MAEGVLGSCTPAITLRTAGSGVPLLTDDLAANGRKIGAGWTEYRPGIQVTYVQPSSDGSATWAISARYRLNCQLDP